MVLLSLHVEVRNLLIATNIKGADDDRLILHAQSNLLVSSKLLFLAWKLLCVHEQELGAEQANALSVSVKLRR